jgi:phenylacetate-CoA ligase
VTSALCPLPSVLCPVTALRQLLLKNRLTEAQRLQAEWLSTPPEAITAFQLERLRVQWRQAIQEVPYYRQLVADGKAPRDFDSLDEYRARVPVLTRQTLLDQAAHFKRSQAPDLAVTTAGSSGNPVRLGCWKDEATANTAVNQWAGRLQNGMQPQDPVLLLWGHSHLLGTGLAGRMRGQRRKFNDWLLGYCRLDAYHVDGTTASGYYEAAMRFRPKVVIGYACALDLWARHCLAKGTNLAACGVKLGIACSEMFPKPDSREIIGQFLGAPVVMEYGGVEFGVVAYQLGSGGDYRVFWSSHLIEVNEEAGGELLVSSLTDRYVPLFRYKNGDACEGPEERPGGSVLSFKAVKGRVNDTLTMPDGRIVHSVAIFHCIHQEPVWAIQLVKARNGQITKIRVVASQLPDEALARIRKRLGDVHPDLAQCPVELLPDLGTNRAGKRRWILEE